jgi:hypothetical protein
VKSLTVKATFAGGLGPLRLQIKKRSRASLQIYRFVGGISVDALVFEFMGLAMLALCIVVLAVPSQRRSARRMSDYE